MIKLKPSRNVIYLYIKLKFFDFFFI